MVGGLRLMVQEPVPAGVPKADTSSMATATSLGWPTPWWPVRISSRIEPTEPPSPAGAPLDLYRW